MLVLSRREGESVCVGEGIVVTVVRICGNKVRIGVAADKKSILRAELRDNGDMSDAEIPLEIDVAFADAVKQTQRLVNSEQKSKEKRAVA